MTAKIKFSLDHIKNLQTLGLTKRFFLYNARFVGRVINDSWLDEIAFGSLYVCRADSKFVPILLAIFKEFLDTIILHLVLNWAKHYTILVVRVADLKSLREIYHCLDEWLVYQFVHVNSFRGYANLPRISK